MLSALAKDTYMLPAEYPPLEEIKIICVLKILWMKTPVEIGLL